MESRPSPTRKKNSVEDCPENTTASRRGLTPEWVGWTVAGPSPAEGCVYMAGSLVVGEAAPFPYYPEG